MSCISQHVFFLYFGVYIIYQTFHFIVVLEIYPGPHTYNVYILPLNYYPSTTSILHLFLLVRPILLLPCWFSVLQNFGSTTSYLYMLIHFPVPNTKFTLVKFCPLHLFCFSIFLQRLRVNLCFGSFFLTFT